MGRLDSRIKKLEQLYGADVRLESILWKIFPVKGEYQQVSSLENKNIIIRRNEGETEDQFFERAESQIRTRTYPKREVIAMIADSEEEN
jgi:hypothetical protein